jgi:glyoxylase-like metal-dependent hydrolase (beta-lactamase superfamily II)
VTAGVWRVGDVVVTRVAEQQATLPVSGLFPDCDVSALAPHLDWLRPHFVDEDGQVSLSIHALVIESGGRVIVVDTCVGEHAVPALEMTAPGANPFLDRFAAAGFDPERVDFVLCTHLHFDHVGWNTRRQGDAWVPTFPNARYLFGRAEYTHWSSASDRAFAGNLDECVKPIFDAGLAELVEERHAIDERVRLVPTPGHTPGHVSVRIESRGEVAFVTGDMTHHPVQWAEPRWKMMADDDSERAAETRCEVGPALEREGALVIGTHYPDPTAGWLERDGAGLRFVVERPDRNE